MLHDFLFDILLFKTLTEEKLVNLAEICMDEDIAKAILKAAQSSMGMDCSSIDMSNIMSFTKRMVKLAEYRLQVKNALLLRNIRRRLKNASI